MEEVGEDAQFHQRSVELLADLPAYLQASRALLEFRLEPSKAKARRHQALGGGVVEFASDALAFLLLQGEQLSRERGDLALCFADEVRERS